MMDLQSSGFEAALKNRGVDGFIRPMMNSMPRPFRAQSPFLAKNLPALRLLQRRSIPFTINNSVAPPGIVSKTVRLPCP
jgi:hypothetical protein